MAKLSQRDLEQIEEFLRGLYQCRRPQPLVWYVLTELPKLVGTNQVSWNDVVPALGRANVTASPAESDHERYQAALERHMHEHPLIAYHLATGDTRAIKVSDFLSRAKFHGSALYFEMYRGLQYEDHFALQVTPFGAQWTTLVVARDRRTFSERDRAVLDLLRPHLAQAHRHARAMSRLARRLDGQRVRPATARLELDGNDAIVRYPARAERWIEYYFDDLPRAPQRLPVSVLHWLAAARAVRAGAALGQVDAPLVVRCPGRRLSIHLAHDEQDRAVLLLEERTDPRTSGRLAGLRLTERELDVLLHVESGMRNDEIAAELGMRPATVKKHLERIFDKLGVESRTAAVARLHNARNRHR